MINLRLTRHAATSFAGIAIFAMILAGCGSTTAQTESSSTTGSSPTSLTIASASAVSTLSVNQEAGIANYQLAALYQEGLTGVNANGRLIPALAKKWESKDNKTWVFDLRNNVKFHDGTTLTADDVLDSINVARNAKLSPGLSVYWPSYVSKVQKTGEYQITITLSSPHSDFAMQVSNVSGLFVTSKKFREKNGTTTVRRRNLSSAPGPIK